MISNFILHLLQDLSELDCFFAACYPNGHNSQARHCKGHVLHAAASCWSDWQKHAHPKIKWTPFRQLEVIPFMKCFWDFIHRPLKETRWNRSVEFTNLSQNDRCGKWRSRKCAWRREPAVSCFLHENGRFHHLGNPGMVSFFWNQVTYKGFEHDYGSLGRNSGRWRVNRKVVRRGD